MALAKKLPTLKRYNQLLDELEQAKLNEQDLSEWATAFAIERQAKLNLSVKVRNLQKQNDKLKAKIAKLKKE